MKPDQLDLLDITANRHQGADTSIAAFESTPPSVRGKQRGQVFELIREFGADGLTTDEASRLLGIAYTAASARMTELKAIGAIKDSGNRRLTSHGKSARVMVSK